MIVSGGMPSRTSSRTAWTVIRVPAMQGFPKWISGLTWILLMSRIYTFRRSHSKRAGPSRGTAAGLWRRCRSDTVFGHESFWIGETDRDAGRGDGSAALNARSHSEVQGEE